MTDGAAGSLHVARRLWCAIPAAMPAGCVVQNSRVLTYSHCLHHLRLSSCRAFTSHRPRTAHHARRMPPQAPAASAAKEDGAKFPSTAGQGSQRIVAAYTQKPLARIPYIPSTLFPELLQLEGPLRRTNRLWSRGWTPLSLTVTVGYPGWQIYSILLL